MLGWVLTILANSNSNMLKYFYEMKKSHTKAKYLNTEKCQQAEYILKNKSFSN